MHVHNMYISLEILTHEMALTFHIHIPSFLTDLIIERDFQSNKSTYNKFNCVNVSALVPSRF